MARKVFALCALAALSVGLASCNTLTDVTKNPNCVTRVSLKGSYGGGIPTGTWSASATCNAPVKPQAGAVSPAPAEDPTPPPPPT